MKKQNQNRLLNSIPALPNRKYYVFTLYADHLFDKKRNNVNT